MRVLLEGREVHADVLIHRDLEAAILAVAEWLRQQAPPTPTTLAETVVGSGKDGIVVSALADGRTMTEPVDLYALNTMG